jgi:glycosyltransferase involved in cell wall biosynthesis
MRIGIMLRHLDQHGGGVLVYTHNLLNELLSLKTEHEFVLLYRDPRLVGVYSGKSNISEVAIRVPSVLMWDQLAPLRAERREKLDIIFNPKYSLPLLARKPGVFVSHGLDWYVMPWGSKPIDRLNHRLLIPRYARKATAIVAVSNTTRDHLQQYLHVPSEKIQTIYLGVHEAFRGPVPRDVLDRIKRLYNLPDRYLLYAGQIYPPKNFGRLLQAYARVGPERGIRLVVAGEHTWLSEGELALIDRLGLSPWVIRMGWIGHRVLPAFYALAEGLLLPSLYEACPGPVLEAMAVGCPIVTANRYGTEELAANAAVLVDPESVDSIEQGIRLVLDDPDLRQSLVEAGFVRSAEFTYEKCARQTLQLLEAVAKRSFRGEAALSTLVDAV